MRLEDEDLVAFRAEICFVIFRLTMNGYLRFCRMDQAVLKNLVQLLDGYRCILTQKINQTIHVFEKLKQNKVKQKQNRTKQISKKIPGSNLIPLYILAIQITFLFLPVISFSFPFPLITFQIILIPFHPFISYHTSCARHCAASSYTAATPSTPSTTIVPGYNVDQKIKHVRISNGGCYI